jgi:hypothetical protein
MTLPRPVAFPGGRVLSGWWKQLAAWQPRFLWMGAIGMERLEALCEVVGAEPLAPLDRGLLGRLHPTTPLPISSLDRMLGLGPALLEGLLGRLERCGAVRRDHAGWLRTPFGHAALDSGALPTARPERRAFWFLAGPGADGLRSFIAPFDASAFQPVDASPVSSRSLDSLKWAIGQEPLWKRRRGFPEDVQGILTHSGGRLENGAWERIAVVSPHRLQAVIVACTIAGGPGLAFFPYQEHGWSLAARPVIELAAPWQEVFPDFHDYPSGVLFAVVWF